MIRSIQENLQLLLERVESGDVPFVLPAEGAALERRASQPYASIVRDNPSIATVTPNAEAIIRRINDIAFTATKHRSFVQAVNADFHTLVDSVGYSHPSVWVNGIWISYLLGSLPWLELHAIPGDLPFLLTLSRHEALSLWTEAQAQETAWISGPITPLTSRRLMPTSAQLRADPDVLCDGRVATTPEEVWSDANIPPEWLALLQDQKEEGIPRWERLWGGMVGLLPSVHSFLHQRCLGVALVHLPSTPSPVLFYLYKDPGRPSKPSKGYAAAWGGLPLGDRIPPLSRAWDLLTPELRAFYRTVHNGWSYVFTAIPNVEGFSFLTGHELTQAPDTFLAEPFHCHEALWLVRGDDPTRTLCLYPGSSQDPERTRAVLLKGDDFPWEVAWDVDFWAELDKILSQKLRTTLFRVDQLHPGTQVTIRDSPFLGCTGEIHSIDEPARLGIVLLQGHDRRFPVQVSLDHLI